MIKKIINWYALIVIEQEINTVKAAVEATNQLIKDNEDHLKNGTISEVDHDVHCNTLYHFLSEYDGRLKELYHLKWKLGGA